MQLILDTNGLTLSKRNESFYIRHKTKGRRLISPHRVSSIAVIRDCLISTAALRLAAKHRIPIHFCTTTGKAEAAVYSAKYDNLTTLRRTQVLWGLDQRGTKLVVEWFDLKTKHQIQHLQQLANLDLTAQQAAIQFLIQQQSKISLLVDQTVTSVRGTMLGLEGSAAKHYWQTVSIALPADWQFNGRSRRPAMDYFNCVLNYLYGMTYNLVENAIRGVGLDPYFGFFHVDGHGRPTLVYDMIEPFRPWVDGFLTDCIKVSPNLRPSHFQKEKEGWWLSKEGRKYFIPKFNDYMAEPIIWQGYNTSRKNHIHRLASQLAQQLKPKDNG